MKAYLVSKGINEDRIKSEGFGETQPVADNGTAAGRTKNRRVEIKIEY
jgi:OmpA-OmpF porin, OOP family